jgi:hypothetical protein
MKYENAPAPIYTEVEKKVQFTGLCVNCDNKTDCKIRKAEYVIWHCEEYL